MKRVVITGLGAVTPFGEGVGAYFDALRHGKSGVRRLSLFQDPQLPCQVAAEIPDFDPLRHVSPAELKRVPRVVPIALAAAREALRDGQLDLSNLDLEDLRRLGVIVGTGGGGIEFAERQYQEFFGNQSRHVTPYCVSSSFVGMLSSEISIALGIHGISHVISTGCTSSSDALGYAYRMIRSGDESILLTGGAESCITPGLMAGFCRMKVMSTHFNDTPASASRPFDRDRDGFVLGEGSWMFLMESLDHAKNRDAKIYAEVVGYASTCDAYHRVAAKEDGVEPARAMTQAMHDAGIPENQIQYVNLHGTATRMNDVVESKAIKLAFNGHHQKLLASATKSMIGHPQGACGSAGVMAGVFALVHQFLPPTVSFENPDPECDLNIIPNQGVARDVRHVLCNTIAFGSKNSALLLRRWEGGE